MLALFMGFHKWGYRKMDDLYWKILLKWMIWGYPYFRKPIYIYPMKYACDIPIMLHPIGY